jgi:hypothetical protein
MQFNIANKINGFMHISYGMAVKKDLKQTPSAVRALCSRQPRFPAGRLCAVTGGLQDSSCPPQKCHIQRLPDKLNYFQHRILPRAKLYGIYD